jgi:hypothetical protein
VRAPAATCKSEPTIIRRLFFVVSQDSSSRPDYLQQTRREERANRAGAWIAGTLACLKITILVACLAAGFIGCADERPVAVALPLPATGAAPAAKRALNVVTSVSSPAPAGAAEPFLAPARDGGILLSWLEPVADHSVALRFAHERDGAWSAPRTIVQRKDLLANWADFPSIIEDAAGTLFAQWLQKSSGGAYSYDVWMATSRDAGVTWSKPFLLNRDAKAGEHGFVTMAALPQRGVGVTWLDGRNTSGHGHGHEGGGAMTIRYANVDANGAITAESELDRRVCDCCTTGMAMSAAGPVIAYRDRSAEEIRDISVVRQESGRWTEPRPVRNDGWKITGCPVNGPQLDARGTHVAAAWFTAANDRPRVYAALSKDDGATFAEAIVIDEGKPLGRVDVILRDDDSALVTWLEQTAAGAEIRARIISQDGKSAPSIKVADASTARAAGFTRIARAGSEVWFTWTEQTKDEKHIRVSRM